MFGPANLFCLASSGPSIAIMVVIAVPVIIIGLILDRAKQKQYRNGTRKGIRKSKDFFDWMFYNYDK